MENLLNKISSFDIYTPVHRVFKKYRELIRENLYRTLPYFVILFVGLFLTILTIKEGYYEGHDSLFHHTQIMSYYNSFLNGDFLGYISNSLIHNFGVSIRMFYSSFVHTFTVIIGRIIIPLGFTMTTAMKFVNFLSFVFSGIFAYWLGLAVFRNNKVFALVIGIAYMSNPYKVVDVYVRQAYAENFAATFIPLFFYSIYIILHEDKAVFKSYLILAISTALLLLSHYVTALFAVSFAVIYVIINGRYLINKFKEPKFFIYALTAVISVVLVFLPKGINLIVQNTTDVNLRVFMDVQGANLEGVLKEVERSSVFFTYGNHTDRTLVLFEIICGGLLFSMVLYHFSKSKKWYCMSPLMICFLAAAFVFGITYKNPVHGLMIFLAGAFSIGLAFLQESKEFKNKNYIYVLETIAWALLFILAMVLIYTEDIWKLLPSFFYKIQFPWRLWFFAYLFGAISILAILTYVQKFYKPFICVFPALTIMCFGGNRCLNGESVYNYNVENKVENVDMNFLFAAGWQLEYFNNNYWDWIMPESPLYYQMRRWLSDQKLEITYTPYVKGGSKVTDYVYETAKDGASFVIESITDEEATIYMPIFYFEGYEVSVTTIDGQIIPLDVYQVDGLVTFKSSVAGTYSVKFVGTKLMQTTQLLTDIFVPIAFVGSSIYFIKRKRRKDDKLIFSAEKL